MRFAGLTEFAGKKIHDWTAPGDAIRRAWAMRVRVDPSTEQTGAALITQLAEEPKANVIEALVVGSWAAQQGYARSNELVSALVKAKKKFTALTAIFLGDIPYDEAEISWLYPGNLTALLKAYPAIEVLWIRGGNDLSLGKKTSLPHLRTLVVQSGGLPRSVVRELATAHLPALEHLELWLGTDRYGGDATVEDVRPILTGRLFPKLKHLGLKDSVIADGIAAAIANAPVLSSLDVLDLSQGALGDAGGIALLASPLVSSLKMLTLRHHYLSDDVMKRLSKLKGVKVDVSEQQAAENTGGRRYVAVSE